MDSDTNNITSNGFGNTLTRDGQGSATANQPMNGFHHTNVGNAQTATDYLSLGQYQLGEAINWSTDSGPADAIAVTYTPAMASLTEGQLCFVRAAHANATATPTFAPSGLAAHTITKAGGAALIAGDIQANQELILRYNLSSTRWELCNPQFAAFNPQASNTNWVVAGGSANAITATYSPAITALLDGMLCFFRATTANTTTTPTFAPNGLTAHTITKEGGTALLAGDIPAALAEVILRYNLANTRWEILNPVNTPTAYRAPTVQIFTSGAGATYTAPTSPAPLYIHIQMCGGGAGGGARTTNGGTTGNTTSFQPVAGSAWSAVGGVAGAVGNNAGAAGGAGGSGGTTGTGTLIADVIGSDGGFGQGNSVAIGGGGKGGDSAFFGGGGCSAGTGGTGANGATNTGGGGQGGGYNNSAAGAGGGGGESVEFIVSPAPVTATYTVGAAANGGAAGGAAGGNGAAGRIVVTEHYQ